MPPLPPIFLLLCQFVYLLRLGFSALFLSAVTSRRDGRRAASMAHHNNATSGARQTNLSFELASKNNTTVHLGTKITNLIIAQQIGSPLNTSHTYQPLQDLVRVICDGEISMKRFHGNKIYTQQTGTIMNNYGEFESFSMDELTNQDEECPTGLATIIICLSAAMTKVSIGQILAFAILLSHHGTIDPSVRSIVGVLKGKIEKYATAVLNRDGMCNKLENAKRKALACLRSRASFISQHRLFLPPFSSDEERDFTFFIVLLWSSKSDGEKIYTQSIKLLSFALLLREYGWQLDVIVEKQDRTSVDIAYDTGALTVIYSSAEGNDGSRTYVENHFPNFAPPEHANIYPTAICNIERWLEVAGLSFTSTIEQHAHFMAGCDAVTQFWDDQDGYNELDIIFSTFDKSFHLFIPKEYLLIPLRSTSKLRTMNPQLLPMSSPTIWELLESTLGETLGYCASARLIDVLPRMSQNVKSPPPRKNNSWFSFIGAKLAILFNVMKSLVRFPPGSLVRVPASHGISSFLEIGFQHLEALNKGSYYLSSFVQFCAMGLAGLSPRQLPVPTRTIGFWNGQQGLLLASVFHRAHVKPKKGVLVFYNTPIMGIPTDDVGWIKAGIVDKLVKRESPLKSKLGRPCTVILEYRPHFEQDSGSVVAAAYIDGVFHTLLSLAPVIRDVHYTVRKCSPTTPLMKYRNSGTHDVRFINIDDLDPGQTLIPLARKTCVIVQQTDQVSRWFSLLAYKDSRPVLHSGCSVCVLRRDFDDYSIIIPELTWSPDQENEAEAA